eukprot:gnl/Trimastix_PCT/1890.p1 GENE.gnl/Trimastix_PCT/1890~~gnl/Trimastix_PCT/1890.p1  ORF type:complete len:393 (+),score=56.09 gnl/Trimastix_PCT/1890:29-1180(+)
MSEPSNPPLPSGIEAYRARHRERYRQTQNQQEQSPSSHPSPPHAPHSPSATTHQHPEIPSVTSPGDQLSADEALARRLQAEYESRDHHDVDEELARRLQDQFDQEEQEEHEEQEPYPNIPAQVAPGGNWHPHQQHDGSSTFEPLMPEMQESRSETLPDGSHQTTRITTLQNGAVRTVVTTTRPDGTMSFSTSTRSGPSSSSVSSSSTSYTSGMPSGPAMRPAMPPGPMAFPFPGDDPFSAIAPPARGRRLMESPLLGSFGEAGPFENPMGLPMMTSNPLALLLGAHGGPGGSESARERLEEFLEPVSRGADEGFVQSLPTTKVDPAAMPEDKQQCAICLLDWEEGDEVRTLPCLHIFHAECIDRWLRDHNTCPVCKTDVQERD